MAKLDIRNINTGDVEAYSYLGEAYVRLPHGMNTIKIFRDDQPVYVLDLPETKNNMKPPRPAGYHEGEELEDNEDV